jgi:signal peptidase I
MRKNSEEWGDSLKTVLREYAESLIIAVFLAFIVRVYVVSAYQVPTSSMSPALIEGDFIFGYKLPFGLRLPGKNEKLAASLPKRGEPVIFRCPQALHQRCIKRVVGLPGDRVEIRGKRLIINAHPADYEKAGEMAPSGLLPLVEKLGEEKRVILISDRHENEDFGPIIVPPSHFFALGDNRDHSQDSRLWGPVPLDHLEAQPLFIWLSFDWGHPDSPRSLPEVRWSRLFRRVD